MNCASVTFEGRTKYFRQDRIEALMKKLKTKHFSWVTCLSSDFKPDWMDLFGDEFPSGDIVLTMEGKSPAPQGGKR